MENKLTRNKIGTQVHFSGLKDPKFKHNRLTINFIVPLDLENASDNAMAMLLSRKGSKDYPDFAKFNAKLNSLYGATVFIEVTRFNKFQHLGLGISFLDNRYAMENEDLVTECSNLLLDLLFNPNFDDSGVFPADMFALEQQYLIDSIQGEINEKRSYAISRMKEEMYKNSPIVISQYGNEETANKATPDSTTKALNNLIKNSQIEVMFSGSGDSQIAKEIFENKFANIDREENEYQLLKNSTKVEKVSETTEKMDGIQQGKLVMGMRVDGLDSRENIYATKIFSAAYGGTPFSKLFLNVREKLSLCYYCASRFDELNNLLIVDSGVESQNVEKAKEEIINQLNIFKNADFTDEEFTNTKLLMANSIRNVNDSLYSLESWYMAQIIKGTDISPNQEIENLKSITKDMVVRAANNINLDTVYLLAGKEEA